MDTDNKGNIKVSDDKVEGKGAWPALHHPVAEMERVIDRFFGRGLPSLWRWEDLPLIDNLFEAKGLRLPTLDVIDRYADIMVRAEIPGVDKKDINVCYELFNILSGGQFAVPEKLSKAGFVFADTDLKNTITRILK